MLYFQITEKYGAWQIYFVNPLFLQLSRPVPSFPPQIRQPLPHLFRHPASSSPNLQNLQPSWNIVTLKYFKGTNILWRYLRSGFALGTFSTAITVWVGFTIGTFLTQPVKEPRTAATCFFLSFLGLWEYKDCCQSEAKHQHLTVHIYRNNPCTLHIDMSPLI